MIANPAMKNEFAKTKEEIALDVHREQKRVLREQEKTARRKVKSGGIPENPLYGLSRKGDEQIRLHKLKLKEQQIIAHKPANAFNAPITTPEQARRTKNIARNS